MQKQEKASFSPSIGASDWAAHRWPAGVEATLNKGARGVAIREGLFSNFRQFVCGGLSE
jgi:hypothetical protein